LTLTRTLSLLVEFLSINGMKAKGLYLLLYSTALRRLYLLPCWFEWLQTHDLQYDTV